MISKILMDSKYLISKYEQVLVWSIPNYKIPLSPLS